MPIYPTGGTTPAHVSSAFGPRPGVGAYNFHYGVDFGVTGNAYAVTKGTVTFAGSIANGGLTVYIRLSDGTELSYQHLASIAVRKGQDVTEGQLIGVIGKTGNASGVCLHFEVIVGGTRIDPLPWLAARIASPATTTPSTPLVNLEEYSEMPFIVVVNQSWFLVVPQGSAKPRAVVLGGESEASKSGLPILRFTWEPAITALKAAVDGL